MKKYPPIFFKHINKFINFDFIVEHLINNKFCCVLVFHFVICEVRFEYQIKYELKTNKYIKSINIILDLLN